ncbi:hypothetical protein [Aeromonas caviae]|uniref:Uncharacterized protein n=1 Tax=Aeromonas caviae TaxID=648 RepID=A0AAW9F5S9_AERCA|nr:hypothetical protein [Aeromonas caviae]MDX7723369.1 hypothetical protein [Aeromonas caviae]
MTATQQPGDATKTFSFGESVPVLSQREVFDINEIGSIKASLLAMNDWAGEEIIRFNPYKLAAGTEQASQSDQLR